MCGDSKTPEKQYVDHVDLIDCQLFSITEQDKKHQTTIKTSGFSSDFAPVEIKIMVDAHYWKNQTLSDVSHCGIK